MARKNANLFQVFCWHPSGHSRVRFHKPAARLFLFDSIKRAENQVYLVVLLRKVVLFGGTKRFFRLLRRCVFDGCCLVWGCCVWIRSFIMRIHIQHVPLASVFHLPIQFGHAIFRKQSPVVKIMVILNQQNCRSRKYFPLDRKNESSSRKIFCKTIQNKLKHYQ